MLDMCDHGKAAFYPSMVKQQQQEQQQRQHEMFNGLKDFVDSYLTDSEKLKIRTEHF